MADTETSVLRPKRKAAKVCARKIDKMIEQNKVASRNNTPVKRKHSDISSDSTSESESDSESSGSETSSISSDEDVPKKRLPKRK